MRKSKTIPPHSILDELIRLVREGHLAIYDPNCSKRYGNAEIALVCQDGEGIRINLAERNEKEGAPEAQDKVSE